MSFVISLTWMKQICFMCTYLFPIFLALHLTLTHRMVPDRGLSDCKHSGVKGKKIRLTYAFTSNADGSEKLPPFVIGKAAQPQAFNKKTGAQLGFYYRNNAKAWMTAHLYQEWIQQWDHELSESKRKILLIQDNIQYPHSLPNKLKACLVLFLTPFLCSCLPNLL